MFQPASLLSAVPVPFDTNGDLDVKGQETLLRHLKDTGIGGVFIAGTTGEFTALDDDERCPLERPVAIGSEDERSPPTLGRQDAPGHATETHSRGCARLKAGSSAVACLR